MTAPDLLADAAALAPALTRLRHDLHAEPEIGLDLPRTQRKVLAALAGLPLEVTTGRQLTSVVAVLHGARPGRTVLLRADMDGLPVQEETGLPFASTIPGQMHACGHDLHSAMLTGAARLLCARRDRLAGSVVFMFQPGEEHDGGARLMIEEGVLDASGQRPAAAYALHVLSTIMPRGQFGTRAGLLTAIADEIHITVTGTGGHGSAPALATDPVVAASAMVTTLAGYLPRAVSAFDPVVLTIGSFHAGAAANVIPGEARLGGTFRSFSPQTRHTVLDGIRDVVRGVADTYRVHAEVSVREGYPAVRNDPGETRHAAATVRDLFGQDRLRLFPAPSAAAEDFAFVQAEVPSAFVFLGACPDECDPSTAAFSHSPDALFSDQVLPDGAAFLAALALRRLGAGE